MTWSDLRLQRNLRLKLEWWLLGIVLVSWLVWWRASKAWRWASPEVTRGSRGRLAWMATLTMFATVAGVLLALEAGLRAAASRLPDGISALRRDLGEPRQDPRWQTSPRYGRRLRANVNDLANEWRDGDIVRMGFVPPAMSEGRIAASPGDASTAGSSVPAGTAGFDRGLFTVSVSGHTLRWAFMPPYLNLLNYSESDLAARRGWTLALENIRGMQRASSGAGAQFVLMFIPFKSQVYLPLLERAFAREDLARALHFYLPEMPAAPDVERFSRNRLAQNTLMCRFCEQAGIPFLDLTTALQERVERGENMYFPDDSHLNDAGEALTAAALATFLATKGLIRR